MTPPIKWPEPLINDLARRRAVLFLGAGVSKNAKNADGLRPLDWNEFLRHAASSVPPGKKRKSVKKAIDDSDLLTACELVRRFVGPDGFKTLILEEYSNKKFEAEPIFKDLAALDSRIVLTTNFDKIYEHVANQLMQGTVLVKNYYDVEVADALRRKERCIIKVHGSVDDVGRTVFTRSDYARMRTAYSTFYQMMHALFLTHTFVFVGASMKDPDMQLLLEDYAYRFPGSRPHYLVTPDDSVSDGVLELMEETMNLRALRYDAQGHHKNLAKAIIELVTLVQEERQSLTMEDW